MPPHNVAPEHGRYALCQQPAAQLHHMRHIQRVLALFLRQLFTAALAQVKGLVTADVELIAGEQGAVLADKALNEVHSARIGDVQRMMVAPIGIGEGLLLRMLHFAELLAGLSGQDLIHMTEAGKRGHPARYAGPGSKRPTP